MKVAGTRVSWVKSSVDLAPARFSFPAGSGSLVKLVNGSWDIGGINGGSGELTITPTQTGSMWIDGKSYRGRYRFIPASPNTFDIVNDVDIDGYLKGVLPVELYANWSEQTYRAQAIAARTYAIYESRTAGQKRNWDVFSDQRSQMYSGMSAETGKSVRAVDATAGMVVAAGPEKQERIFKAYFSSCCGGRTQSAYDAFGDPYSRPLSEIDRGATCSISPKFNWGPVTIRKDELSRRLAGWAKEKSEQAGSPRPELKMQGVAKIEHAFLNKLGRPVYFYVTDNTGQQYLMKAEDLRLAICWDAADGKKVYSGYFDVVNEAQTIRFINGHGYGHGVGLCQWCAQRQAQSGWNYEQIILAAYPGAKLIRAY